MKLSSRITLFVIVALAIFWTLVGFQGPPNGRYGSITIANSNTASGTPTSGSNVDLQIQDARTSVVAVTVSGTWTASGGLIARASSDGGNNWIQMGPVPFINANTGVASATIPSGSVGTWYLVVAGLSNVRIDAEGTVTGTAVVGETTSNSAVAPAAFNNWGNQTSVTAATGTAIKASAGTLVKVLVTTSGSAATLIYDNASANSGTVIGAIPASPAVGTVYTFGSTAANGIYAGTTNTSGFTAYWN
jgi:hypothetical protein